MRNVSRIIDAAANRASEGLRVVEDYARFVLDDPYLTGLLKRLRHDLGAALSELPTPDRHASRETQADVGTAISTEAESLRPDTWSVCQASLERTKQAFRSLEEFSKVDSPQLATQFEQLRYRLYTIEKSLTTLKESRSRLGGTKLCVLIDGRDTQENFSQLCQSLIATGVGMIQLRAKNLTDRELIERGRLLCSAASRTETENPSPSPSSAQRVAGGDIQGSGTLVIINDRPDIAAAVDANGVHLGQDDMSVKDARAIVGPRKLIGVSTHNIEQARRAVLDGADYLGAGPTFPSATKQFDAFPGLDFLRQVAGEITLPTFAIGGICPENIAEVLETKISRVAVSSAVVAAAKPASVAENLLAEINRIQ